MIYLLVGVPASGKTWICDQLRHVCTVVSHDAYKRETYSAAIVSAARHSKCVIAEAPFYASGLVSELIGRGFPVQQVLVTAPIEEIERRYKQRAGKDYPANFRTNHARYAADGQRWAFRGSSAEVLDWLTGQLK